MGFPTKKDAVKFGLVSHRNDLYCTMRTFHLGIAGWQFLQLARGVEVLSNQHIWRKKTP